MEERSLPADGGGGTTCNSPPCAASLLGDVGLTTATGMIRVPASRSPPAKIFTAHSRLASTASRTVFPEGLGCSPGSKGHVSGGIDTFTAEQMVAYQCGVTLPRVEGNRSGRGTTHTRARIPTRLASCCCCCCCRRCSCPFSTRHISQPHFADRRMRRAHPGVPLPRAPQVPVRPGRRRPPRRRSARRLTPRRRPSMEKYEDTNVLPKLDACGAHFA